LTNPSFQSIHAVVHQSLYEVHQARFRVKGKSMQPFIQKGDWITIASVPDHEILNEGDIVLFSRENEFVVHRIIEMNEKEIITQGDRTRIKDLPISKWNVIGKVIEVEKRCLRIKLNYPLVNLINLLIYQVLKTIKH